MTEDGAHAPAFALPDDTGQTVSLADFKGRTVVVYFYPKDDTSGCTQEAKDFSALAADFEQAGIVLLGISPDNTTRHQKFKAKHDLTVRLLSDEQKAAATAYGVWVEKSMYGRKYMGVERSTFLIDKTGRIARSWHKVKIPGHADEVLAAARSVKP
jgi:thioredoxin-dependent peroxiredoxin